MILQYIEGNMFLSILHHIFKPSLLNKLQITLKDINITDLITPDGTGFKGRLVNLFEKDIGGTSIKGLFNDDSKFKHFLESIYNSIMNNQHSIVEGGKVKLNNLYNLIKDELRTLSTLNHPHYFSGSNADGVGKTIKQAFNPLDHFYGNHELAIKGTGIATAGLASLPVIGSVVGSSPPTTPYPSISLPSAASLSSTDNLLPSMIKGAALLGGAYATYKYLKNKRNVQPIHP